MQKNKCDIGTLASEFSSESEVENPNVVKVAIKEKLLGDTFANALDFLENENSTYNLYHHIGIYAFTNKALAVCKFKEV